MSPWQTDIFFLWNIPVWQLFKPDSGQQLHKMQINWIGDSGRVLGAMPFGANFAGIRAQLRANRTKKREKFPWICIRAMRNLKEFEQPWFSAPNLYPQGQFPKPPPPHRWGGVCCIFLEGGRQMPRWSLVIFCPTPHMFTDRKQNPQCVFP